MLNISGTEGYFTDSGNDVWHCKNGFAVGHGILDFYRANSGLLLYGLPLSNEIAVAGHSGVVFQRFERGVLCYDPGHVIDNPPGSSAVYPMHIESGAGQDPRIGIAQAQLLAAQQKEASLQAELDALQGNGASPVTQRLLDALNQIDALAKGVLS